MADSLEKKLADAEKRIQEMEEKLEGYSSATASLFAEIYHQIKTLEFPRVINNRIEFGTGSNAHDIAISKRGSAFVSAVRTRKGLKT